MRCLDTIEQIEMSSFPQTEGPVLQGPMRIHSACDMVQALMKLQRAAELITSTFDLDQLLDRFVSDLAMAVEGLEAAVWLREKDSKQMVLQSVRGSSEKDKGIRLRIESQSLAGFVAATERMRYIPTVGISPFYGAFHPVPRAQVTIPLTDEEGDLIGVFTANHQRLDAFSEEQTKVLEALAGHVAAAIRNLRRFQQERLRRERLEQEGAEARAIQRALFGKAVPLVPGFAFETAWHPAGAVAGDWFDFIDLGNGRYGIVLADVSGKGMPAALLMSTTRVLLRTIARLHASPGPVLTQLSDTIAEDFPLGKFVTMIYGILDVTSREMIFASAGHLRPLLVSKTCAFMDLDTGLPLGLGASSYPEHTVKLEPGTHLLLYTDGITETANTSDEEYGPLRLLQHFQQADACIAGLIEEVRCFSAPADLADDATAVLIRSR